MKVQLLILILLSSCFSFQVFGNNPFSKEIAFVNPCQDAIYAGKIGNDQTICELVDTPNPILNIESPQSNSAQNFESFWIYTTDNPFVSTVIWYSIPTATSADYAPTELTQTTWFRRCTRNRP